jgi:hypothetical protein
LTQPNDEQTTAIMVRCSSYQWASHFFAETIAAWAAAKGLCLSRILVDGLRVVGK